MTLFNLQLDTVDWYIRRNQQLGGKSSPACTLRYVAESYVVSCFLELFLHPKVFRPRDFYQPLLDFTLDRQVSLAGMLWCIVRASEEPLSRRSGQTAR